VLAIWTLVRGRTGTPAALSGLYLAAAVTTGVTLAATAVWVHHAQAVAYTGLLLIALATSLLESRIADRRLRTAAAGVVAVAVVAAFGGFTTPAGIKEGVSWRSPGRSETADALEAARSVVHAQHESVSYAVLGRNTDQGHAAFLRGSWHLACPRFHQYPFSQRLDATAACIRMKRPLLVLVDSPLSPDAGNPDWTAFVRQTRRVLRDEYVRLPATSVSGAEIWRRR
jgi:hypothetical protein